MQLESISLQVMYVMWCRLDLGAFFEGQRCSKSGFEVPLRPWDAWRCLKMSEILFCFDMSHVLILRLHAKEVSHLWRGILEPQIRSEICFRITLAGQDWSCGHKRGIHVSLLDHQCGELLHEVLHCEPQKPHGGNENELTEHSPQEHIPKFVDISTILRIVDMWRRLSLEQYPKKLRCCSFAMVAINEASKQSANKKKWVSVRDVQVQDQNLVAKQQKIVGEGGHCYLDRNLKAEQTCINMYDWSWLVSSKFGACQATQALEKRSRSNPYVTLT